MAILKAMGLVSSKSSFLPVLLFTVLMIEGLLKYVLFSQAILSPHQVEVTLGMNQYKNGKFLSLYSNI